MGSYNILQNPTLFLYFKYTTFPLDAMVNTTMFTSLTIQKWCHYLNFRNDYNKNVTIISGWKVIWVENFVVQNTSRKNLIILPGFILALFSWLFFRCVALCECEFGFIPTHPPPGYWLIREIIGILKPVANILVYYFIVSCPPHSNHVNKLVVGSRNHLYVLNYPTISSAIAHHKNLVTGA